MRVNLQRKCIWLAGASATAIMFSMPVAVAQDAGDRRLGTVLVTTQKTEESIQDVPIAVSAFDEDALEDLQLAGGPDLVKSIPNVAFSKGNFAGYNFKIRGIGADLVAQSGDAGVGVHQNDVPLTANRLFEAEFFDVERVETLRGPQGTLYGRNATGGVINVITAKPVLEEFQGDLRVELGSDDTFKTKGMLNLPIGDNAALRVAGSVLQRDGFAFNSVTGNDIDDRDLYGFRATLAFEPTDRLRGWLSYDRFEEDDRRARITKQLCAKDPGFSSFAGIDLQPEDQIYTSLGCQDAPLSESNERVNSVSTLTGGYGVALGLLDGDVFTDPLNPDLRVIESAFDPIYKAEQDLWTAKVEYDLTDSLLLTAIASHSEDSVLSIEDYNKIATDIPFNNFDGIDPALIGAAEEAEALAAGLDAMAAAEEAAAAEFAFAVLQSTFPGGVVDDAQVGASNFFRTFDQSGGASEQDTFELRLQSDFDGPLNFNLGAIYLDFEAIDAAQNRDGYYVISNTLTALAQYNNNIYNSVLAASQPAVDAMIITEAEAIAGAEDASLFGGFAPVDTTGDLFAGGPTGAGHNYFRSISPYTLESFAIFGEGYYDVTNDLQLTLGLRYTSDKKEQENIPTYLYTPTSEICPEQNGDPRNPQFARVNGNPNVACSGDIAAPDAGGDGTLNAEFEEVTGRVGFDWSPDFAFSEDTLIYGFYSRGYKGGGINPPQPAGATSAFPQIFEPEFIDSFEIGTKNTLAGGALQLNATGFYYDYEGYQITQIINRTSANFNIDAEIQGFELETRWAPVDNLMINMNLGLLDTEIQDAWAIDVLDRTNGRDDLVTIKNGVTYSNCVVSSQGYAAVLGLIDSTPENTYTLAGATGGICSTDTHAALVEAFITGEDVPANMGVDLTPGVDGFADPNFPTGEDDAANIAAAEQIVADALMLSEVPTVSYIDSNGELQTVGFLTPIEGEAKSLSGNSIPNAPETTFNLGAAYTFPMLGGGSWDLTLRGDYYYQSDSFSRVWNTSRDELESWDNVNLALELYNSDNDVSVEIFGKNITDEEVITGAYLTDDSSGLFTNIFLTEPRTYGIAVSKSW